MTGINSLIRNPVARRSLFALYIVFVGGVLVAFSFAPVLCIVAAAGVLSVSQTLVRVEIAERRATGPAGRHGLAG